MDQKSIDLVIISGVTGAIGSALFAQYAQRENTVVYGISRKARSFTNFVDENGKLPHTTIIFSLPGFYFLCEKINFENVRHIIYVHAMGLYPFEIDAQGKFVVSDDMDGDGVNDTVKHLTYNTFVSATSSLRGCFNGKLSCVIFAGLADKHKPNAHTSWWLTMERTKKYMRQLARKQTAMIVCTISSVLCPHEIITRPFIFTKTDADPKYFLNPYEVAQFVAEQVDATPGGFKEIEKFRAKPGFDPQYYCDEKFTPRKVAELYG